MLPYVTCDDGMLVTQTAQK